MVTESGGALRAVAARVQDLRNRRRFVASFSNPEWMLSIPPDLNGEGASEVGWLVLPIPSGQHVFVISNRGTTTARDRQGNVVGRFHSALPAGSPASTRRGEMCILECVAHNGTFYVMDMLCWRGMEVYDCTAEFRQFWLRQRLDECDYVAEAGTSRNSHPFVYPMLYECSEDGLRQAYSTPGPFQQDGLMFFLKGALYDAGLTPSPVTLFWKDARICASVGETLVEREGTLLVFLLVLCSDGGLATADGVVLGQAPSEFVSMLGLQEGDVVRIAISGAGVSESGVPVVEGARCLGRHDTAVTADSWSRIVFHARMVRNGGAPDISVEALVAAAAAPGAGPPSSGLSFAAPAPAFPSMPSFTFG